MTPKRDLLNQTVDLSLPSAKACVAVLKKGDRASQYPQFLASLQQLESELHSDGSEKATGKVHQVRSLLDSSQLVSHTTPQASTNHL